MRWIQTISVLLIVAVGGCAVWSRGNLEASGSSEEAKRGAGQTMTIVLMGAIDAVLVDPIGRIGSESDSLSTIPGFQTWIEPGITEPEDSTASAGGDTRMLSVDSPITGEYLLRVADRRASQIWVNVQVVPSLGEACADAYVGDVAGDGGTELILVFDGLPSGGCHVEIVPRRELE
ncbi:MAG: hypothetical protein KJ831_08420 [Candidatus Eisenbacteria bacterium]|nr:hypothetical protein [Candidatus Eisenbacteria bacterium]